MNLMYLVKADIFVYLCITICIAVYLNMPIRSKGVVCYMSLGRCQQFVKLLHTVLFLETFTSLL